MEILRAANWVAARDGLAGTAIDSYVGRPVPPARQLEALVDHIHDSLDELGEYRRAQSLLHRPLLHRQLELGNRAMWQRRAMGVHGDTLEVVRMAARRTLQDTALLPEFQSQRLRTGPGVGQRAASFS